EAQAPTAMEQAGFAARGLGTASFNGDLLLDGAANHAGAGYFLLAGNAMDNGTCRFIRNPLLYAAGIGLRPGLRYARADRNLAPLFLDLSLADGDLALDRNLLADALHAGDRTLFPDRAGNPDLDGLGSHRTRLA